MANGFDPDESFDQDAADRATTRGLKIVLALGLGAVALAILWPWVKGLIGPAIVLGICAYAAWAFRDHPSAIVVRGWIAMLARRAWDAVFASLFRRGSLDRAPSGAHSEAAKKSAPEGARSEANVLPFRRATPEDFPT